MKRTGFGVTIARGDGGDPETFTEVAQVADVTPPQYSRDTVDVTDKDSADGYKEFIGSLKDAGDITMDLNYDPDVHNTLLDDFDSDDPVNWRISFPTTPVKTCTVAALITGFAPTTPMADKMAASVTFKVSGKPVWA